MTVSEPTAPPPGARSRRVADGIKHGLVAVEPGVRLHYVVAGDGAPVVLLPGWPQSWYTWRFVIPGLIAAGRRVYAVDPRGLGDSDLPTDGYDLDTGARDMHRFLELLGLLDGDGGVDVVSHDIGSWIAHAHAAAYPEDVHRLVLSDAYIPGVSPPPTGFPDAALNARQWHFYFNRVEGLPEAMIYGKERDFLSWFFGPQKLTRPWAIEPDAFDEYLRVFTRPGAVRAGLNYYRAAFSDIGLAQAAARLARPLNMPILTLGGAHADADNLFHTFRDVATTLDSTVFDGVGHHITEECPDDVLRAIHQFWRDHP